jgi:CheY-like chemotaxis protein
VSVNPASTTVPCRCPTALPALTFSPEDVIVVADDETFSRFMAAEILGKLGDPRIVAARDGEQALAVLDGDQADAVRLVLLDFNMPGPNGLEVLKAIRCGRLKVSHRVVVMMVTGVDAVGLLAAAIALDVDAFLTKPLSPADLRDHLSAIADSDRELGEPASYAQIDVSGLGGRPSREGRTVALADLTEGMVIAADLLDPQGHVVVAAGSRVTARLIRLLRGLAAAGLPMAGLAVTP